MHVAVIPWLTATFLSIPLLTLCVPLNTLIAPHILRVGTQEQVLLEVQDGTGDVKVKIRVLNFPSKDTELYKYEVTLNQNNSYQDLVDITIPFNDRVFKVDSEEQQYVYLQTDWGGVFPNVEKIVLVSFQAGYLFIQTDKTLYTPDTIVQYRVYCVNSRIKPIGKYVIVKIVTPEGIVVWQKPLQIANGAESFSHKLGNPISNGIWKIVAAFNENPNKNFTAEFEVKEYRLPSFEVNLKPNNSFYFIDDEAFTVNIDAKYLFGKKVEGSAFVVFGVYKGNEKISIRSSLKRVDITNGEGKAELKKEQILQTFPDILELVGNTLYISVSVLTDTGSEMVEAERRGIHIVTSPYTIQFTRSPKYFKPGLPFSFKVYVTNPDGTPAKVALVMTHDDVKNNRQTSESGIALFTINTLQTDKISITVKTNDVNLASRKDSQAVNTLIVHPYTAKSQSYLHINLPTEELVFGKPLFLTINIVQHDRSLRNHDITYVILSKGQIVSASKLKRSDNPAMTIPLTVTKDMVPSFRVVAYYHLDNLEVISDSIWVDVKDTCIGPLQVEIHDPQPVYVPNDPVKFKITGTPKARVIVVSVDKGVYVLNNKNRLTQTKIWDLIEAHDIGCTSGSGKDSMGVFYDAGLLFLSSQESTADRREPSCTPDSRRKKRHVTESQVIRQLVHKYNDTLKQCCRDGMVKNFLGYTCERRAEYIEEGAECREAFLYCCQKLADLRKEAVQGELTLSRSEEDEANELSDIIVSRSKFPETWLWNNYDLPDCENKINCESTLLKSETLPDSITTWVTTAVSISDNSGICVSDSLEVIVKKNFFIDLKLPYAATVNEQIEIKAVIHNLNSENMEKVYVELIENEEICSVASFQKKYRTTVSVGGESSRAVPFVIIPLKAGQYEIEVKAFDLHTQRTDGVRKKFNVMTQGVLTSTGQVTLIIEPEKHGGKQRSEFKRPYLQNQVPDTEAHTYIAATGRPLSQTFNEAISGINLGKFIERPYGCGEQNLLAMVLPVLTTHYLDKTKQWNDVGVDKRTEALQHINTGYVTELTYRKPDYSFAVFRDQKGSTWLTAYVVKIFSLGYNLIYIDHSVICNAIQWLITTAQDSEGKFTEVGYTYTPAFTEPYINIKLTALVVIALEDGEAICGQTVPNLSAHIQKAAGYIARNIASVQDSYTVALASCALASTGQLNSELLFRFASSDRSHWAENADNDIKQQATGYALLALLKIHDFENAKPIVTWLKTISLSGPYSNFKKLPSSQAFAVVFEALSKYLSEKPQSKEGSLTVIVSSTARATDFKGYFTKNDKTLQRSDKFMANGDLTVTATGKGEGSLTIVTLYYTKPGENYTKCKSFDLEVKLIRNKTVSYKNALATYTIIIDTKFLSETRQATMTILDISLLTGFIVDTTDLENLMGKDRYIQKFEINSQLSERGSVIIYLKKVSNEVKERIVFRVHLLLKVGLSQPAAVTVYEYYNKEDQCVKFYDLHTELSSGSLKIICPKEVCSCAEANCPRLKGPNVPDSKQRIKEACRNKDFIYKATLEDVTRSGSSDAYSFIIESVIKEGTDKNVENDVRDFYAHIFCKEKLGLQKGKDYLIMGPEPKLIKENYRYTIGSGTWLEYWPTQKESQDNKNNDRQRYIDLSRLAKTIEEHGCTT